MIENELVISEVAFIPFDECSESALHYLREINAWSFMILAVAIDLAFQDTAGCLDSGLM